jgi:hypothetical protein
LQLRITKTRELLRACSDVRCSKQKPIVVFFATFILFSIARFDAPKQRVEVYLSFTS